MYAHPLFRPLAAAAAAVVVSFLAAHTLLTPALATLEGVPAALLARAGNVERDAGALWIAPDTANPDVGQTRSQIARAINAAHGSGARAILVVTPLVGAVGGSDLGAARALLDAAAAGSDAALRNRLDAWVADLDHDAELERAIRRAGNVVLLSTPDAVPLERFAEAAAAVGTAPSSAPDADGVTRATRLVRADTGQPSLEFAAWLVAHRAAATGPIDADPQALSAAAADLHVPAAQWLPTYGRRSGTAGGVLRLTPEALAADPARARGLYLVIGGTQAAESVPTGDTLALGEAVTQRLISLEQRDYATLPRLARTVTGLVLLASILFGALWAPGLRRSTRWVTVGLIVVGALLAEVALLAGLHVWIPLCAASLTVPLATLAASLVPERGRTAPASGAPVIALPPTLPRISRPPRPRQEAPKRPDVPPTDPFLTANVTGPNVAAGLVGTAEAPVAAAPLRSTPLSLKDIQRILEIRREEPTRAEVADMLLGRSKRPPKPKLGRYEIDRELGHGAMGTVFLGKDPTINRTVAIKAIPIVEEFSEADLAEARERFFREAEMAGRLKHSSIVTVYDAGEDGGIAWIAMEYIQGQTLADYTVKDRLLPAHRVLEICARVADALDYAHAQAVVHRDIKPANVLFQIDTLETKITDFGIARLTNSSSTRSGIVLGTPSFMAPERLEGRAVTGRSDLFALGVTLYQLLVGELPFRADSMAGLMEKIIHNPHPSLRTVRPDLPVCVGAIVDRALQKDPNDRFQSAGEMAKFLRACARACHNATI